MNKNDKILEEYGYPPEPLLNDTVANGRNFSGNYQGESIKRLKLTNCNFNGANFNDAAVTGSSFYECSFQQCDMDQGDFEYCDFNQCDISSETPIAIAFDNSNFIGTVFHDLEFYSSTFSNAYFDETEFRNIKISNCTLEAATFHYCRFVGIDFTRINLDFVDFRTPYFKDSVLPMSQIVYTYGLLQYMMTTDDCVSIAGKGMTVTPKEYINKVLPALLESYLHKDEEQKRKIYFPLINILLSLDKIEEANIYLEKALNLSAAIQDFRMMKHYCKLINFSEHYSTRQKKSIYQRICSHFQPNTMTPWQLKDYSRNIGDIKYILLIENNLPTLIFNILTDVYHSGIDSLGTIVADIFHISDKYTSTSKKDIRIELSRNSPIMISIHFTESMENIFHMLNELLLLTCYTVSENYLQKKEDSPFINYMLQEQTVDNNYIKERLFQYQQKKLSLALLDFHIENWKQEYNQFGLVPINFVNPRLSMSERN